MPKVLYESYSGLKFAVFDYDTLTLSDPIGSEYDEEAEVLVIQLDRPCSLVAYIDDEFEYLDETGEASYNLKTGSTLAVRIGAPLADFLDVFLDGRRVDPSNYEATEGSTIITLKKNYLQSLSAGTHQLTVYFNNGSANTTLTIIDPSQNPFTGDSIVHYLLMFGVCFGGLAIAGFIIIKRKRDKKRSSSC